MEIATKPLVMASEIAGLEWLQGYIKQENRVIPVRFKFAPKKVKQPEFIERKIAVPQPKSLSAPAAPESLAVATPESKPISPEKLVQAAKSTSAFGQKQGTVTQKPSEWDESQWID